MGVFFSSFGRIARFNFNFLRDVGKRRSRKRARKIQNGKTPKCEIRRERLDIAREVASEIFPIPIHSPRKKMYWPANWDMSQDVFTGKKFVPSCRPIYRQYHQDISKF